MFAARIRHPLVASALHGDRPAFDAALARWCDFLAARPGLRSFTVTLESDGRHLTAQSVWRNKADFEATFADPGFAGHGGALLAFFAERTAPEFLDVLAHRP
ncbi:hypothetical protein [Amaricoccus sp.]|uniref:hypothetical protein n=1 Tax=Amaricoccus sp. TaxID=1872485 RepID=UPI001B58299A|nr:hypothetical protein [Amaricoccus sp.]MBP7003261.1 hypothetical protein [Amaricoccus sp.]